MIAAPSLSLVLSLIKALAIHVPPPDDENGLTTVEDQAANTRGWRLSTASDEYVVALGQGAGDRQRSVAKSKFDNLYGCHERLADGIKRATDGRSPASSPWCAVRQCRQGLGGDPLPRAVDH